MASGKKNYFRHSMNARNDHKLKTFMASFGRNWREGYFYFFSLLELCGNDAQDGKTEHTFHINTLRELWGTSTKGAHEVCKLCTSSALVMCNIGTNHVTFSLPNLLNYTGQYEKKGSNKSNQSKLNEIKESTLSASPVLENAPKKNLPKVSSKDFRNPKDSNLETAEDRQQSTHAKLAAKGSILNPEWIVIEYYNKVNQRDLKQCDSNYKQIRARLKEGFNIDEMKTLIDHAADVWAKDDFWARLNRPSTLFNGKMDEWLGEATNPALAEIADKKALAELSRLFPGIGA